MERSPRSLENLTKGHPPFTPEDAARHGAAGGRASGEARRRRKGMAELARTILSTGLDDRQRGAVRRIAPDLADEDATVAAAMVARQVQKAMKGDTRAFETLAGMDERASEDGRELPPYRMDPLDLTSDLLPLYRCVHEVRDGRSGVREIIAKGGRGGAKSSVIAEVAYEVMRTDPLANIVYNRRYKADLRTTVFSQFCKVVARHGDESDWKVTTSPMQVTYLPTGTSCYFFGADNPLGNKSFTPETGYVALLIQEECDEMAGMEQMEDAESTYLRSNGVEGARQIVVRVFNPPASRSNFMNAHALEMAGDPSALVVDASYLSVPVEWLGQRFFERAEWFRAHRPDQYRNKFLGEVTGTGGELFSNVEACSITDAQIEEWEHRGIVYQGIDWGFEHPQVFMRVAYDPDEDCVYPIFERRKRRCKLETFFKGIMRFRREETICDSAEPDKIADARDMGWEAVPAVKRWRGGGRGYAWEWLRSVDRIRVDPERTPGLFDELTHLEFERLRDGQFSSRYPDEGEDGVMATVYALNRVIVASKDLNGYEEE